MNVQYNLKDNACELISLRNHDWCFVYSYMTPVKISVNCFDQMQLRSHCETMIDDLCIPTRRQEKSPYSVRPEGDTSTCRQTTIINKPAYIRVGRFSIYSAFYPLKIHKFYQQHQRLEASTNMLAVCLITILAMLVSGRPSDEEPHRSHFCMSLDATIKDMIRMFPRRSIEPCQVSTYKFMQKII